MAWRIDKQVVRGEIDNRTRGRVTGQIWFLGLEEPVHLDLKGDAWRDLAGYRLRFTNPAPEAGDLDGLAGSQEGVVGDMTASRKVRIPECSYEEIKAYSKRGESYPWHWGNCLYLEWFSERNGRVVIESVDYQLELDADSAWTMTESEERAQQQANQEAITGFMDRLVQAMNPAAYTEAETFEEDDAPQSRAEAEADAEAARMDLLLDRVSARFEREGRTEDNFETIMEEERERLRRERGEPEPEPLTPEEEAEREAWIEEMNAAAMEAVEEAEANGGYEEPPTHPLVDACSDLGIRLHHEVKERGWIPEGSSEEHPLYELMYGVQFAGAKLAGALCKATSDEPWPPDPLYAGDTLVRLKKARGYLRDALGGLDAADEERLADSDWRGRTRYEVQALLDQVSRLIEEVRSVMD